MPYIGDITPRIASPSALEHVGILQKNDDVALGLTMKASWVDLCFASPDRMPYELKRLWTGVALAATPVDLSLLLARQQDLTPLLKLAQTGTFPLLMLQGDADRIILCEKVVPEIKAMWKNAEVVIMEGTGHSPFYEETTCTMQYISDFVESVRSRDCSAGL